MNKEKKNIYHCCVQKTGSQWIKAIFSDEIVSGKTGMTVYTYQKHLPTKGDPRKLTERIFDEPFPENCIISPLYMDYNSYTSIPKPGHYKTFCIIRDPRDIVISWYYSTKVSHPLMGKIPEHRKFLRKASLKDGLIYCMEYLRDYGLFDALRSWASVPGDDPNVMVIRFEDIVDVNKQFSIITDLFSHCSMPLNENEIRGLLDKYSFENMRNNKKKGEISHYRKGKPGSWGEYFDDVLLENFYKNTGKLLIELGYE